MLAQPGREELEEGAGREGQGSTPLPSGSSFHDRMVGPMSQAGQAW